MKKIDHLGIAVADLEAAEKIEAIRYQEIGKKIKIINKNLL